jgi:hypothetical protein
MNSKLIIIGLMFSSLLAISISGLGQTTVQKVILQDDKSGDHLIFAIPTGEYKFESCNGNFSGGGVGSVSVTGCKVVLLDMSDTKRVLAEVDLCERVGKADIAFAGPSFTNQSDLSGFEFVISDSKTADSAFTCEGKPIDPK